jgi:arabinofuranan 3-O-arabinosyltransferase
VSGVEASSSQAYADATPPLAIGSHPGAVFDHDPNTAWVSARDGDPKEQWWQADFTDARTVSRVGVRVAQSSLPLTALRISGGGQSRTVPAPKPGHDGSFAVGLPSTTSLRITPVYDGPLLTGSVALSEVQIDELSPQRYLRLPAPLDRAPVDVVALSRDPDRFPCVQIRTAFPCDPALREPGDDGDVLARQLTLPDRTRYAVAATASLRRTDQVWPALFGSSRVRVTVPQQHDGDPAEGPGALADGDPSTTWVATASHPEVRLTLPHRTRLSRLQLELQPGAAASLPRRLVVHAGSRRQVVDVAPDGSAPLPHRRVRRLAVEVESTYPAFTPDGRQFTELGPGVSELKINGKSLTRSVFTTLAVPCGQGPKLDLGGTVFDTSVSANARSLLRGASVPLELCVPGGATPHVSLAGPTDVVAAPTTALRVDSLTLTRPGAALGSAQQATVDRDGSGMPTSVEVPARSTTSLLSMPQNINPGWEATLDGKALPAQRANGWQQGWVLPAGPAATVDVHFTPARLFTGLLLLGAVLAAICVAAVTPLRLRRRPARELPALRAARVGRLDAVLVVVAAGFLTGWVGLGLVALTWWVARRFRVAGGWAYVAGLALLVATAGLTWGPLKSQSWSVYWAQTWAMVAVAAVSAALLAPLLVPGLAAGTRDRPSSRAARGASSSGRS